MQKELELVQLLASLNEKIDTVEKQLKYSTDLSVKIERLVEDVSSIKASMGELQFMLMGDGQNMGLVTRVAGLEKNFDDREKFMEKTVEPAMEKQQRILFDLESFKDVVENVRLQKTCLAITRPCDYVGLRQPQKGGSAPNIYCNIYVYISIYMYVYIISQ